MIYRAINGLIRHAIEADLITNDDIFVVRNQLMDILKLTDWNDKEPLTGNIEELLEPLIDYAVKAGIIEDTSVQRDLFDTRVMGVFTPMPREVNAAFQRKYSASPSAATEWYYAFSKSLNYVRAERIAKDLKWTYESEYGTLDITINRSKPEKDPRDIAAAKLQKKSAYPQCQLCVENMGFAGHQTHPARQNLRPVKLNINSQDWFMQYSPYGYYNEHCIVFNKQHIPMTINAQVFNKLFDFVEQFPHYFIGSNADLPIVGGSILTHEHFQGGNYNFAMAKAPIERTFLLKNYMNVSFVVILFLNTKSHSNPEEVALAIGVIVLCRIPSVSAKIPTTSSVYVLHFDKISAHAAAKAVLFFEERRITDIGHFTMPALRPLGVFHPNPTLHHIKKENIGLIEVMGLAVLPARLADELTLLKDAMLSGKEIATDDKIASHAIWANEILKKYSDFNADNAMDIIRYEVGRVFEQVLEDAGVFKRDKQGKEAFARFVEQLG